MKKNKKILIFVNNLRFFLSHRLAIAEALLGKGFDIFIGYGELCSTDPKLLEKKGFKVELIPMKSGSINLLEELKTFFFIWRFLIKIKPDIVHLVTIKPYLYGGIASRLVGIKCLVSAVSGLGTLFIHNDLKSRFLRLLLHPIYRLAFGHPNQKVIIQNNDDKKLLFNWGVLHSNKAVLIKGSGVNLENFPNVDEPNGVPLVCFAGRLLKDKGVYDFISAAKLLKERGVRAQFCLIGDLDLNNPSGLNLKDLKMIKQQGHVKVLGYHKNIPFLYSKSNIICLPSYREGLPKALIEAAAASRAVVTTDVPGCRDAIIPNVTGLLVPVKNPQKLANALQWLIENPKKRIEMGKAGRKFAENEFGIEKVVQTHLEIYQYLLGNNFK